jgi:hypothetical protein
MPKLILNKPLWPNQILDSDQSVGSGEIQFSMSPDQLGLGLLPCPATGSLINTPADPGSATLSVPGLTSGAVTIGKIQLLYDASALAAPASFRAGIEQAASIISAAITDKITVNINIYYSGTGGGAYAGPDGGVYVPYSTVQNDLINGASAGDKTFNALPSGTSIQGQLSVVVWAAQEKLSEFGLLGANDTTTDDGSATFATDINPNLLVGVALHELTHALGRINYGPQPDIFDLFRFTAPGTLLFQAGPAAPPAYFSVDGGATKLADYGQSSDASDFLNGGVQGPNDPFNEFYTGGTLQTLTAADLKQLDALGFHLAGGTSSQPDLIVSSITLGSASVTQGTSLSFSYVIKNQGNATAGPSSEAWQVDSQPTATSYLGSDSLGSLAAGATASFTDSIATAGLGVGTHTLWVAADNSNTVAESNETNNWTSVTFTVTSGGTPPVGTVVSSVVEQPSTGDLNAGKTVIITLSFSAAVTVAGGTPTLTLNDGGTATYSSGSGGNSLSFSYAVGAHDTSVASLSATAVNLNGATIKDGGGNAANLSLAGLTQNGPQIDTTVPAVTAIVEQPSAGDLNAGKTITITLNLSEAVIVAGGSPIMYLDNNGPVTVATGTPSLTLNDGGAATYSSGSGSSALNFSYTVGAHDTNVASLAATAVNLNGASVSDGAGNLANLSLAGLAQNGPQVDTTVPAVTAIIEQPSTGDLNTGKTVTITLKLNEAVTVAGGTPTLTLNDGGTATYSSGSGGSSLNFSYTVGAHDANVASLAATTVNLNGASMSDGAGNLANLSLAGLAQNGPQIDTTVPAVTAIVEQPSTGDLNAGKTVTITLNLSEAVTVAGGIPTLTLNDGGTATYSSGSGSSALNFSYTVGARDNNVTSLAATAVKLNGATVSDGAGNLANLSLAGLTQNGPQIDTTVPAITAVVEQPSTGYLSVGKTVTITLDLSEAVTVAGGVPTLTLNDGGTATYSGGSGSSALTFLDTVSLHDTNVASLAATSVNLNGATIADGAGNVASLSLVGLAQNGPHIDANVIVQNIQGDYLAIVRATLPLDQATTIANAINAGTQTEAQYVSGLLSQVADTTIPAVAVEGSMYGLVGSSAEVTSLTTQFLPAQVTNAVSHGLNPVVYASEVLGLAFAFGNETGSTAFAAGFGPARSDMPSSTAGDAAFAAAASSAIFGAGSTTTLVDAIAGWVANWKAFYSSHSIPGMSNPTAAQIDLAARGAAWGDAVGLGLANNLGPLNGQAINFLENAAQGTAVYSAALSTQPNPVPFQGAAGEPLAAAMDLVQLLGIHADHSGI